MSELVCYSKLWQNPQYVRQQMYSPTVRDASDRNKFKFLTN